MKKSLSKFHLFACVHKNMNFHKYTFHKYLKSRIEENREKFRRISIMFFSCVLFNYYKYDSRRQRKNNFLCCCSNPIC